MKAHEKALLAAWGLIIFFALTAQAAPQRGIPPEVNKTWYECIENGGTPSILPCPEKNETEGPHSDVPCTLTVYCEMPEAAPRKIRCDDGTELRKCSKTKPYLCTNKRELVATCSECGCPEGLVCVEESCEAATTTSIATSTTIPQTTSTTTLTETTTSTKPATTTSVTETTSTTLTTTTTETEQPEKITANVVAQDRNSGYATIIIGLIILVAYAIKTTPSASGKGE